MCKQIQPHDNLHQFLVPDNGKEIKVSVDTCKLCQSTYRNEAEAMYDQYSNVRRVHKFLRDDRHEDISYQAVRNHIQYHHQSPQNSALIREYGKDVSKWINTQEDSKAGILRSLAVLEREMFTIGSQSEELSLSERRRNAETIKKIADAILNHRTRLDELNSENQQITLVFQQLQIIIQEEIKDTNSPEAKNVVRRILRRLENDCKDIIVYDQ